MLHGDISNQRSFCIGFRCENTLLHPKKGIHLFNKWANAEVDKEVLSVMKNLYWNTEYTVALIVDSGVYDNEKFRERVDSLPINTIMNVVSNISEITMWLNTGELSYFITNDIIEKSNLNSKFAVSLEEFSRVFKNNVKGRIHW